MLSEVGTTVATIYSEKRSGLLTVVGSDNDAAGAQPLSVTLVFKNGEPVAAQYAKSTGVTALNILLTFVKIRKIRWFSTGADVAVFDRSLCQTSQLLQLLGHEFPTETTPVASADPITPSGETVRALLSRCTQVLSEFYSAEADKMVFSIASKSPPETEYAMFMGGCYRALEPIVGRVGAIEMLRR